MAIDQKKVQQHIQQASRGSLSDLEKALTELLKAVKTLGG